MSTGFRTSEKTYMLPGLLGRPESPERVELLDLPARGVLPVPDGHGSFLADELVGVEGRAAALLLADADTGRIAIYYGCADTVTGLCFAQVDELIDFIRTNADD